MDERFKQIENEVYTRLRGKKFAKTAPNVRPGSQPGPIKMEDIGNFLGNALGSIGEGAASAASQGADVLGGLAASGMDAISSGIDQITAPPSPEQQAAQDELKSGPLGDMAMFNPLIGLAVENPKTMMDAEALSGSVVTGIAKAGFNTYDALKDTDRPFNQTKSDFRKGVEAASDRYAQQTPVAPVVEDITSFVVGLLGAGKLMAPLKAVTKGAEATAVGRALWETGRGAIAGYFAVDPHQERLSDLIQTYPVLQNPVSDFLSSKPGDTETASRLKNAIEGIGLDLGIAAVFEGGLLALKAMRSGDREAAQAAIDSISTPEAAQAIQDAGKPRVRVKAGSEVFGPDGLPVAPVEAAPIDPLSPPLPTEKPRVRVKAGSETVPGETPDAVAIEQPSAATIVQGIPEKGALPEAPKTDINMFQAVVDATERDVTKIEQYGSYEDALLAGHNFSASANLPWQKMNTPDDVNAFINNSLLDFKPELDAMKGGDVLSDPQVSKMVRSIAKAYNADPTAIIGDLIKAGEGAKDLVKQMEAGYMVSTKMFLDTYGLIRQIKAGGELAEFGGDITSAVAEAKRRLELSVQVLGSAQSIRSNVGRTMRRMSGKFAVSPEMLAKVKGMDDQKFVDLLFSTQGNPAKLREVAKPGFWKIALDESLSQVSNGLLWLYPTHMINTVTAVFMLGARPLEKMLGSFAVSGGSAIRNQAMKEYYYTLASSLDGMKAGWDTFLKGDSTLAPHGTEWLDAQNHTAQRPLAWVSLDDPAGAAHNAWRAVTGVPTRFLGSADEVVKTIRYRAVIQARAAVAAEKMGLKGKDLVEYISKELSAAFDDNYNAIDQAALKEAQTTTFSQELLPGTMGQTIRNAKGRHPVLGFILPYVKTPVNVLRYAVKYTPALNGFQKEYRMMFGGALGPEAQAQAYGQMAMGVSFLSLSATMALHGKLTGGGPQDQKLKQQLIATGWKPYSYIKENEDGSKTYIPYGRFDPAGFVFGIAADLAEIYQSGVDNSTYTDAISASAIAIAKSMGEKSFLLSLNQAMDALTDPEGKMEKFLGGVAASIVPASSALRGYVNQDPYQREARSFLDQIKKGLPGLSDSLPVKRTVLGEPITRTIAFTGHQDLDAVDGELARIIQETNMGVQSPSPVRNGVDLRELPLSDGRNAYDVFQENAGEIKLGGKTLKESLKALMDTETYSLLSDGDPSTKGTKLNAISTVVSQYREAGFLQLRKDYPEVGMALSKRQLDAVNAYQAAKGSKDQQQGFSVDTLRKAIGF